MTKTWNNRKHNHHGWIGLLRILVTFVNASVKKIVYAACYKVNKIITWALAIQYWIAYHFSCLFINQIKVSNSALISAFMTELEPDTPVTQVCYDIYLPEILLAILNLVCVFIYFCVIAVWLWSPATVNQFTNGEKYGIFDWMHGWLVTRTTKGFLRFSFRL